MIYKISKTQQMVCVSPSVWTNCLPFCQLNVVGIFTFIHFLKRFILGLSPFLIELGNKLCKTATAFIHSASYYSNNSINWQAWVQIPKFTAQLPIIYLHIQQSYIVITSLDRILVRLAILNCEITLYHKKNQRNLIWHFWNIVKLCIHESLALQF